jgi:predicted Zn-dependent protease
MSPIRIILEVNSPEEEALVRQHHAFLQEMSELALKAPSGYVIDVCEEAVLEKGQEHNRRILEQAVQKRIESLEKKRLR